MLHNAFTHGNASVWTNWQFMTGDEKAQHALVYVTMDEVKPTKKFYVMKHYSRFIPRGAHRIEASPNSAGQVTVSAYVHDQQNSLTVVLTNHAAADSPVSISLKGVADTGPLHCYITDADRDCAKTADRGIEGDRLTLTLPKRSVMTLTTVE